MSKTAKTRSWFFPTSPRSPAILEEDFKLIEDYDGCYWNPETQSQFGKQWSSLSESREAPKDPALTARDRVNRAPKLLGLITIPPRQKAPLRITNTGKRFSKLSMKRSLYTKQLLKIQFPSPLHCGPAYELMDIKPLVAVALILDAVGPISKEELQLFVLTTIRAEKIDETIQEITNFRREILSKPPGLARKKFRKTFAENRIYEIYKDDIITGNTHVREGSGKFIETKFNTLKDYADAAFRYLLSTELFTFDPRSNRLAKASMYSNDFDFIVSSCKATAEPFEGNKYTDWADNYLGNPDIPSLPSDNIASTTQQTNKKLESVGTSDALSLKNQINQQNDDTELMVLLEQAFGLIISEKRKITSSNIKNNRTEVWNDVKNLYESIGKRDPELIDRPLLYEWNTWRAFEILNDNIEAAPNLQFDLDNNPVCTAPGKRPDMVVEFNDFWLIVEVTLTAGYKQYEAEGESIIRHVGQFQSEKVSQGDKRPVYGIFIAEKINDDIIHFLRAQSAFITARFSGSVRIFPLARKDFEKYVDMYLATNKTSKDLHSALERMFVIAANNEFDEIEWVRQSLNTLLIHPYTN